MRLPLLKGSDFRAINTPFYERKENMRLPLLKGSENRVNNIPFYERKENLPFGTFSSF